MERRAEREANNDEWGGRAMDQREGEEVGIEIPHQPNLRAWKVRSDQISSVRGELREVILEL